MEGEGLALVDASHLCWGVGRDIFRADELYATVLNEDAREEALTRCSCCWLCCWMWRKSSCRTSGGGSGKGAMMLASLVEESVGEAAPFAR